MIRKRRASLVRVSVILGVIWLAGAAWMTSVDTPRTLDPTGRRYGMNWAGDLASMLRWSATEIGLLWIILRPWSFHRSAGRLLLAAALFAPYLALRFVVGMHGGPIILIHDGWLFLLWVGVLSVGVLMSDARRRERKRAS